MAGSCNQARPYLKPHLWLIRLIGVAVPRRLRRDWRKEWEAELLSREATLAEWDRLDWRAKVELTRRSIGAFKDAIWLQHVRLEDEMFQDLRYGLRMLLKNPGFTAIAVITLGLGIGANTAIFSVVNAVLLRPLPYNNANQLAMFSFRGSRGEESWFTSPAGYLNLKSQNTVFTDVAAWGNDTWPANLTGEGEPERLQGFKVSANFFRTLGVSAAQGRTFLDEEDQPGNNQVVVISNDFWQRRFGGDTDIVGKSILLDGGPYTVIGVMAADFRFVMKTEVWTTLAFTPDDLKRGTFYLHQVFRLKPGVTTEQARAEVESLLRPYATFTAAELHGNLKPLQEVLTDSEQDMLLMLLVAVGLVMLIACVNIANLLLARVSVRRKEFAIRSALGARRGRVVRQLLVESVLIALIGGACGLALASWCIPALVAGLPESVAAKNWHVATLRVDRWALGYTVALSVVTTIIFGLIPALQSSKVNLNETLKAYGRNAAQGRGQNRFRSGLMVSEIALAGVVLVGAGLMLKSFWLLSRADRGFDERGVLIARIDPGGNRSFDDVVGLYRQLLERVSAVPGVEHAGVITSFDAGWRVAIDEHQPIPPEQGAAASRHQVSADYFRAMRIPLVAGRFFTDSDDKGALPVAIIDETLARRFFPDEDPLGKHLRFDNARREIVGVVGATRAWKTFSIKPDEIVPRVYVPYQQENWWRMALVVRAQSGDPMNLLPFIRRELNAIDKDQPIHSVKRLTDSVAEIRTDRLFSTSLLTAFAGLAALLAAVGIYGVMACAVAQRTQEMGIRLALGAQTGEVMKLVLGHGMKLAGIGMVIGLLASLALTRVMKGLLFGISATDPLTFGLIALFLTVVAFLACYVPARRAMKVDPVIALRQE
ncbi:MAG TPA: ABC transporter permease [Blastocatellia bacterium]|nr:ABC transporter permease [Blastocatellia bacterium]